MTTNDFYTKQGSKYFAANPTWDVEDSPWKAQKIFSLLQKNNISSGSVIEVGCGAGEILRRLSELLPDCPKFCGYDIAPDAIALCTEKASSRLQYFCKDPFSESETFDLLLAVDVVEHIEDYFGFLRKCKDKATYKIFKIPLDLSVRSLLFNRHFSARERAGHIQYFTKDTFFPTLRDCGYEIIDWQYAALRVENRTARFHRLQRFLFNILSKDLYVRLFGGYGLFVLAK